jgi:hypothetical protein
MFIVSALTNMFTNLVEVKPYSKSFCEEREFIYTRDRLCRCLDLHSYRGECPEGKSYFVNVNKKRTIYSWKEFIELLKVCSLFPRKYLEFCAEAVDWAHEFQQYPFVTICTEDEDIVDVNTIQTSLQSVNYCLSDFFYRKYKDLGLNFAGELPLVLGPGFKPIPDWRFGRAESIYKKYSKMFPNDFTSLRKLSLKILHFVSAAWLLMELENSTFITADETMKRIPMGPRRKVVEPEPTKLNATTTLEKCGFEMGREIETPESNQESFLFKKDRSVITSMITIMKTRRDQLNETAGSPYDGYLLFDVSDSLKLRTQLDNALIIVGYLWDKPHISEEELIEMLKLRIEWCESPRVPEKFKSLDTNISMAKYLRRYLIQSRRVERPNLKELLVGLRLFVSMKHPHAGLREVSPLEWETVLKYDPIKETPEVNEHLNALEMIMNFGAIGLNEYNQESDLEYEEELEREEPFWELD